MRFGLLFWSAMLAGLWFVGWYLTGDAGQRALIPADKTHLNIYLTVVGAGMIVAGALRILHQGGEERRREAVIWIAAMICLGLGYGSREQMTDAYERLRGNIYPSVALTTAQGEAEIDSQYNGHFRAEVYVNGIKMNMLVDTGASMVLIPYEDAYALGINRSKLDFSLPVTTANGRSHVAPVKLSSIKVGPIAVFEVDAAVAQPGMLGTGLLGMSFLNELEEVTFRWGPDGNTRKLFLRN